MSPKKKIKKEKEKWQVHLIQATILITQIIDSIELN
jgi:hypothetical protein